MQGHDGGLLLTPLPQRFGGFLMPEMGETRITMFTMRNARNRHLMFAETTGDEGITKSLILEQFGLPRRSKKPYPSDRTGSPAAVSLSRLGSFTVESAGIGPVRYYFIHADYLQ